MNDTSSPMRLQNVPASAARFCLAVERFCREDLFLDLTGESLVVAYSGGADSRALLFALHLLTPRQDLTVHAATLDHGLRPESAAEVEDAAALCLRLGIRFHTQRMDVAAFAAGRGVGLEEAGRLCRQKFLESVRKKTGSAWVAVGHQLNDLAEDSLMRMTRGTGWPALAGMSGVVPERRIIRPMLLTSRAAVERFLLDIGEPWHEDAMNRDDAYFRNRVRKTLLPLFCKENPAFLETVADRWRMARADAAFFAAELDHFATEHRDNGIFLPRDVLENAPASLRLRQYRVVLASLGPGQATATHCNALDAVWQRNEGGKAIQFPGGKRAVIRDGGILFLCKNVAE